VVTRPPSRVAGTESTGDSPKGKEDAMGAALTMLTTTLLVALLVIDRLTR
jgi:hypothetical protein